MLGPVLFGQAILLYLTLGLVVLAHLVLFRTRFGLALRAAGENPSAADAAGISVARMRYIGVLIGGATAGMAGAYLVLAQIGLFRESIVSGQGFIALGIVIFGQMEPGEGGTGCVSVWRVRRVAAFAAIRRSQCSAATAGVVTLRRHHPGDFRFVRWQSHPTGGADGALLQRLRRDRGAPQVPPLRFLFRPRPPLEFIRPRALGKCIGTDLRLPPDCMLIHRADDPITHHEASVDHHRRHLMTQRRVNHR